MMRFIRADRIRGGDVVLLAGDDVDELFATILAAIEHKDGRIRFTYRWRQGKNHGTEDKMVLSHARCLLIRRPKRRSGRRAR